MQEKFRILTTTPTIDQLKEREFVIVNTGAVSLFTKINGSTYSFTLERK
ncbi:MAG TPA: hypothetical protein VEF04_00810 [Blastocatellia bacterium]|nr:hypothetical protein [Blastocatellia bacterium]